MSHFVEEDDDEVVADAEVRLVELVGHVEAEALELAPFEKDGVEPRQREEQLAVPERLPTPVELLLFRAMCMYSHMANCTRTPQALVEYRRAL